MLPVLRGSCDIADLGPGCEGSPPGSPVFGGGDVIAAEIEEVVDLIMGREEPLCLAGREGEVASRGLRRVEGG